MGLRSIARGFVVAGLLLYLAPGPALAGFDDGPWLQNVAQQSVEVLIEGDAGDSPGVVEYGTTPSYGSQQSLSVYTGEVFRAALAGLSADTFYYYRVTHAGVPRTGTFFTAPGPGQSFSYMVLGDTRTNHVAHGDVVEGVLSVYSGAAPDFFFNTGDIVEEGDDEGLWNTFFATAGSVLSQSVFHAVYGNHDDRSGTLFYDYFSGHATNGNLGYYSFDYGSAHFTILSTEAACTASSAQGLWLKSDLQAANANPSTPFKFVLFHKVGVTTGLSHAPEACITGTDGLIDIFEDENVDIAWSGHNHHYEHTLLNGIHHVTSGGGGAPGAGFVRTSSYTVYKAAIYGFSTVSVGPTSYAVDSYKVAGFAGTVGKVDSWTGTVGGGGVQGPTPSEFEPDAGGGGCGAPRAVGPGEPDNDLAWASLPVIGAVVLFPPAAWKLLIRTRRRRDSGA